MGVYRQAEKSSSRKYKKKLEKAPPQKKTNNYVTNKNYMFYNATNQLLYFKNQFDSKGTPKQWPLILSNTIKGIFYDTSLNKLIISIFYSSVAFWHSIIHRIRINTTQQ